MSHTHNKVIQGSGDISSSTNLEISVGVVVNSLNVATDKNCTFKVQTDQVLVAASSTNMETLLCNHPHPLLIPHIIEAVLDNLIGKQVNRHAPQLRICRLVCSRWNEIGTKLYRKYSEELVFGETESCDSLKMTKYLSDMAHSFDNPIQTYRFDPGFFVQKNAPLFKNFLYSSSHWVVTLKLWFDNQSRFNIYSKRCYPNLKLDNLEYLFFGCVNYRGTSCTEKMELTYILDCLLVSSTRLKKFCFSFPPKDIRSQQGMIKRFGELISKKLPKTVKNLKLEMRLTDNQLLDLKEINLALDTLHCDFRGSTLSTEVIFGLLSQQQATLQEIRLLDSEIKYAYELKFPRFAKLTVLEIQGGNIAEFSYKDNFPVLERLLLFGWENGKTSSSMLQSSSPCTTLTSLELPYKIQDKNIIRLAAKCFPNLKKLEITPTSDGMEVLANVFQFLVQLEELEITFPFIIDAELNVDPIFTGMSLEDCEQLAQYGSKMSHLQKNPCITNLSKLKKLTILDHSNEIRLTDTTAFALLTMESLEVLEMGRFNISQEIFQSLKNKVRLCENYDSSDSGSEFAFSTSEESCEDFEDWQMFCASDEDV